MEEGTSAVHKCDLALHEPRPHNVRRRDDLVQHGEDLMAARVTPPAPADSLTRDELGDVGHGPARGLQQSATLDELCHHVHLQSIAPNRSWTPDVGGKVQGRGGSYRQPINQ